MSLPGGLTIRDGQIILPESSCAICIRNDRILVVRQPRQIKGEAGSLELPGGKLADDESAGDAAVRELYEEAGVVASSPRLLLTLDLDLDRSVHKTHLVRVGEPEVENEGEFATEWMLLDEALARIMSGEITHAPTVTAVLLAIVEREKS